MSAPTLPASSFITTNPLEDYSVRYGNDLMGYAALKIFVPHFVRNRTGKYYTYSKDNLKAAKLEAPSGTEAPMFGYTATTRTFNLLEYAAKALVLERDARDFDTPVADLDVEAAAQNMDKLMIALEIAAHTLATTSGNYPAALVKTLVDSTDRWTDAGGDPVENMRTQKAAVFEASGVIPNTLAMSWAAYEALKQNGVVIDRVKYTGLDVSDGILRGLLGLEDIVVSQCIKNTAADGAADVLASIWDDDAVLFYKGPTRLKGVTYGKAFIANQLYVKTLDKPELGRGLGAHEIETGWEYALAAGSTVSSSDADFNAGSLIINVI